VNNLIDFLPVGRSGYLLINAKIQVRGIKGRRKRKTNFSGLKLLQTILLIQPTWVNDLVLA
jgi:hypothetical protein